MKTEKDKFILDACCGPRYMWYDKHNPNAIFIDIRKEHIHLSGYKKHNKDVIVEPDIIMDFRHLKFDDNSFKLVVMDPPHMKARDTHSCNLTKTFGGLNPDTWNDDIKQGIKEAMRVLEPYGVLIFKWNDSNVKFKDIEKIFPYKPLFFNITSGKKMDGRSQTAWFCFMKIPDKKWVLEDSK